MRRWRHGGALLLAGALLGGCTLVPTDVTPRVVPAKDVPSGLLNGKPVSHTAEATLYFFDAAQRVVPMNVSLEAPVTVRVVVTRLMSPPSNYRTFIPRSMSVLRAIVHGTQCDLTVDSSVSDQPAVSRLLMLQQIGRSLHDLYGSESLHVTDASSGTTYRWVGSSGR